MVLLEQYAETYMSHFLEEYVAAYKEAVRLSICNGNGAKDAAGALADAGARGRRVAVAQARPVRRRVFGERDRSAARRPTGARRRCRAICDSVWRVLCGFCAARAACCRAQKIDKPSAFSVQ